MKIKWRLFWSYDVIKTQEWLTNQSNKGLLLVGFNPILRTFKFKKTNPENNQYMIIYDKKSNGCPTKYIKDNDFTEITHSKNYYILKQLNDNPQFYPSYEPLFNKNVKLKYIVGNILLIETIFIIIPFLVILWSFIFGDSYIESGGMDPAGTTYTLVEVITGLLFYFIIIGLFASFIWRIYTYIKLNKSNKILGTYCGESKVFNLTAPIELDQRSRNKLKNTIKIRKFAWFYAPDKATIWLEGMESKGFNLVRMSKLGNSFYFEKGENKKVKYHVDYQRKKDPNYYSMNEENGWELIFTSITRYHAITVWKQEYQERLPEFYSTKEDCIEHARKFMLLYTSTYIPLGIVYLIITILSLVFGFTYLVELFGYAWLLVSLSLLFSTSIYIYYSIKLIFYYQRVKKGINNE